MEAKTANQIYVEEAAMDVAALVAAVQARKTAPRRPLARIFKKGN